jgi:hypothetical protein
VGAGCSFGPRLCIGDEIMSVHITSQEDKVALFDSTTGHAFGPVFDNEWEAEEFVNWHQKQTELGHSRRNLSRLSANDLDKLVNMWRDSLETV